MPFFGRTQSPDGSVDVAPIVTGLADVKFVGFPSSPVTSTSRLLTKPEKWTLWNFENHAFHCTKCTDPLNIHRKGGSLCSSGKALANEVAAVVFSKNDGREVYDSASPKVRVEIPRGYDQTTSLLRAVERGQRHRRQKPIVTYGTPRPTVTRHLSLFSEPKPTPVRRNSLLMPLSAFSLTTATAQEERPSRSQRRERSPPVETRHRHRSSRRSFAERKVEIVDWPANENMEPAQPVPAISRRPRDVIVRNHSSREDGRRHTVMIDGSYDVSMRAPKAR